MATVAEMIAKVQQDASLREALQAATDQDGRIAAFKAAGLDVTEQDLANAKASAQQGELSDADLERVAGGSGTSTAINVTIVVFSAFG
jgi:predicted ribosomally synthesized peptide with nif11-like leader